MNTQMDGRVIRLKDIPDSTGVSMRWNWVFDDDDTTFVDLDAASDAIRDNVRGLLIILSERCDWAKKHDMAGYNIADTVGCKMLAKLGMRRPVSDAHTPFRKVDKHGTTPVEMDSMEVQYIVRRLYKYRVQLGCAHPEDFLDLIFGGVT